MWLPDDRVALTSISHGCVYIVDPAGGPLERIDTGGGPNGWRAAPTGRCMWRKTAAPGAQAVPPSRVFR